MNESFKKSFKVFKSWIKHYLRKEKSCRLVKRRADGLLFFLLVIVIKYIILWSVCIFIDVIVVK